MSSIADQYNDDDDEEEDEENNGEEDDNEDEEEETNSDPYSLTNKRKLDNDEHEQSKLFKKTNDES